MPTNVGGTDNSILYKWEQRPYPSTKGTLAKVPNQILKLTQQLPEIREICQRRADYMLPEIKYPCGICDGDLNWDMYRPGVELIKHAISLKQPIIVALDYDCDGQTAGACMFTVLQAAGADVHWVVPNRLDQGYGLNVDLVKNTGLKEALVVTVDNGITCVKEVDTLRKQGYTVVVTDHHLQEGELPEADAIINPKICVKIDNPEYMAPGVYVSAKTALLVAKDLVSEKKWLQLAEYCNCLTALGIVSDVIELNPLLRDQLLIGLAELNTIRHEGIRSLFESCGVKDGQNLTSNFLAFSVVPKLNAAGRMGAPEKSVELLLASGENSHDNTKVMLMANALLFLNSDRKIIEQDIFMMALDMLKELPEKYKNTVVLYHPNWHAGVLGIIAARLVEITNKPTIVLTKTKHGIEGSGRSVESFDLFQALQNCSEVLERFGGHMVAAGVGLKEENIDAFKDKFEEEVTKLGLPTEVVRYIDADVNISTLCNIHFQMFLDTLEPHGHLNPEVVLCIRRVELFSIEFKGQVLVAVLLDRDGYMLQCSKYRGPEEWLKYKDQLVDVIVTPTAVFYTGRTEVKYNIVDIQPYHTLEEVS